MIASVLSCVDLADGGEAVAASGVADAAGAVCVSDLFVTLVDGCSVPVAFGDAFLPSVGQSPSIVNSRA